MVQQFHNYCWNNRQNCLHPCMHIYMLYHWHRASEYMIEDGKLWHVGGGHSTRARSRVECVTRDEATQLAEQEHKTNKHWQCNSVKKSLLDHIWSPGLDASIVKGITNCGVCKNFGGMHLYSLLDPITRQHPLKRKFERWKMSDSVNLKKYMCLQDSKNPHNTHTTPKSTKSKSLF